MKIVRVTNDGDKPFVGKFDGEKFTIAPKSETLVPYGAMVLWLGDPSARNTDERNRHRVAENKRLHVKYGAYEDQEKWEVNRPTLSAFTLEGELIPTVVTDPEGDMVDVDLSDSTEENVMRREMAAQRAQLDRIEQMIANGELQVVAPGTTPGPTIPAVATIPDPIEAEVPAIPVADDNGAEIEVPAVQPADESKSSDTPPVDAPARVRVGSRSRSGK